MQAFIVAMFATGCRPGELLSLQWSQIRRDDTGRCLWMDLPVERTKTYQQRLLPIGQRLRSVLEMRETDPKGNPWPSSAYVFGNEVGEPVKSVKTAWKATCRRAGITDLHLNDLRHEFGCRLLESGSRLHDVRDFLGHANIATTSRYLQSSSYRLADALRRLEVATPEKFAHSSHKPPDQTTPPSAPDQNPPVL
jgi:integrase